MGAMRIAAVLCLVMTVTYSKHYHSVMGPFRIVTKQVYPCPGVWESEFYIKDSRTHYKQEQMYSGNLSSPYPIDDHLDVTINMASWSNMGGWKENAHVLKLKKACKLATDAAPGGYRYFIGGIMGEILYCPLPPGIYRFQNVSSALDNSHVKIFFYGRWRTDVQLIRGGKTVMCLRSFFDTLPV